MEKTCYNNRIIERNNNLFNDKISHRNNHVKKGGTVLENQTIRNAAKAAGVRLWEVAEALGIADGMLSRKLRRELPDAERERILRIIEEIAQQKEA